MKFLKKSSTKQMFCFQELKALKLESPKCNQLSLSKINKYFGSRTTFYKFSFLSSLRTQKYRQNSGKKIFNTDQTFLNRMRKKQDSQHPFAVKLEKCRITSFANTFVPMTSRNWYFLPPSAVHDTYNLQNKHLRLHPFTWSTFPFLQ